MIDPNLLTDSLAKELAMEIILSSCEKKVKERLSSEISKELQEILATYANEAKRDVFFEKLLSSLTSHEKKFASMMQGIWEEQRRIIVANLKKMKKAWLQKGRIDELLYPRKQFEQKIAKETKKLFEPIMEQRGKEELAKIERELRKSPKGKQAEGVVGAFDVQNPEVQKWLDEYTPKFSEKLEVVSTDKLRSELIEGMKEGEGIPQLTKRVNTTYDNWNKVRSETIARSEAMRASNRGAIESYRQSGVVKSKMWITYHDERTCYSCADLDGKVIGLEDNYFNLGDADEVIERGGRTHTFKNDYEDIGSPPRHARCRCTIAANFEDLKAFRYHTGKLSGIAIKNEPRITGAMKGVASKMGATLKKLVFRLKTKESIGRKLASILTQHPKLTVIEALGKIQDAVRYTVLAPVKNFSSIVVKMDAQLKLKGFQLKKVTNYYGSKGAYQGINAKYYDPRSKLTFEVQYHTKQSVAIADKNHLLYEKARVSTDPKVVKDLNDQMVKNWDAFQMPKDAPRLFAGK